MKINQPIPTTELLLQLLQTRVESAKVKLDLSPHTDIQLVMDCCSCTLDNMLKYVATITTPGQQHEELTLRAPRNSWHHLLRDIAGFLPKTPSEWLLGMVKYKTETVRCLDIWPKFQLPERHGPCVRTIMSDQWSVTTPSAPGNQGPMLSKKPFTSTITL